MNNIVKPKLIEPGTHYFLGETLKQCNFYKTKRSMLITNLSLFIGFFSIISIFLFYKYKTKPNEEELKQNRKTQKIYVMEQIKNVQEKKLKESQELITNIPKFESDYELLHKKFYSV